MGVMFMGLRGERKVLVERAFAVVEALVGHILINLGESIRMNFFNYLYW